MIGPPSRVKPGPKSRRGFGWRGPGGSGYLVCGGYDLRGRFARFGRKVIDGFRFWVNRLSDRGVHQRATIIETGFDWVERVGVVRAVSGWWRELSQCPRRIEPAAAEKLEPSRWGEVGRKVAVGKNGRQRCCRGKR